MMDQEQSESGSDGRRANARLVCCGRMLTLCEKCEATLAVRIRLDKSKLCEECAEGAACGCPEEDSDPMPPLTGRPVGDFFQDFDRMVFQYRIQSAEKRAADRGESLLIPPDWASVDMPLPLRTRLAELSTEASIESWEQQCVSEAAKVRAPFERFGKCVSEAVPKRYIDARPLPPADSQQFDAVREILRRRVKSREAYKAALAAARGIAEGSVRQVLFVGSSGSGKSTLAAILLHAVAEQLAMLFQPKPTLPAHPEPCTADEFLYRPRDATIPSKSEMQARRWRPAPLPPVPRGWKRLGHTPGFRIDSAGDRNPVQWASARDVFRAAANPPRPRFGEEPGDPLGTWKEAPLLVLDDIGGEPEQRNIEAVDGVLWHRHDADDSVVTITTTGFFDERRVPRDMGQASEEQIVDLLSPLTARYGAALVRRIAEPGQTVVIPVIAGGQ